MATPGSFVLLRVKPLGYSASIGARAFSPSQVEPKRKKGVAAKLASA